LQVARRVDVAPSTVEQADREENQQAWNLLAALRNPSSLLGVRQSSSNNKPALDNTVALLDLLNVRHDREQLLRRKVETNIIESLRYPGMSNRYESLSDAYPETFKWALESTEKSEPDPNSIFQWLKTGNGVYWISGKAGSGKSTLMKYLLDSKVSNRHLEAWASSFPSESEDEKVSLCLATFFFWNSGQVDQKSQKGMLRSLLFQIFSTYPDIIPIVFDDGWAKTYKILLRDENSLAMNSWDINRLATTLQAVFRQTTVSVRICLFIDGLDEFEAEPGDNAEPEDIAKLFKDIITSKNVKALVSSRPWPIFSSTYHGCPFLRLEDLNRPDIIKYVNGKFEQNTAYKRLVIREPSSAPNLIKEIIAKSQGVFLWVRIVVQDILRGIGNSDDVSESLRRLRAMPPQLEPLYHHLLSIIEKEGNTIWASKAFQIIRAVREFCAKFAAGPIRRIMGSTPLSILMLHLALEGTDQMHINLTEQGKLTRDILDKACEDPKVRLTARCAGFLEVPTFERDGAWSRIEYLHRTSRDFLEKKIVWSRLLSDTAESGFNAHRALLRAQIR